MASNKTNFLAFLIPAAVLVLLVVGVNNLFFPLELSRQDKVNRLVDAPQFWCSADTILLGSSRAKYVGDLLVDSHRILNFANDDMSPDEYRGYVDFFKQQCDKAPAHILIAADFFAFSAHRFMTPDTPQFYIERAGKHLQRSTSWSSFYRLLNNPERQFGAYRQEFKPVGAADNVLQAIQPPPVEQDLVEFEHNHYYHAVYGKYELNIAAATELRALRAENPDSKFRVWVTPTSSLLLVLRQEFGLNLAFSQFMETLVRVFGQVDNYMWLSDLSSNKANFWDENHMLLPLQEQLVSRALGAQVPELDAVAVTVDSANLTAHLETQRQRLADYAESVVKKKRLAMLDAATISGPEIVEWEVGANTKTRASLQLSENFSFCLVALNAAGGRDQGQCYRHVKRVDEMQLPPDGLLRLLPTIGLPGTINASWILEDRELLR